MEKALFEDYIDLKICFGNMYEKIMNKNTPHLWTMFVEIKNTAVNVNSLIEKVKYSWHPASGKQNCVVKASQNSTGSF